jgi:valyl-tRNA synthetase
MSGNKDSGSNKELAATFTPAEIENRLYKKWEDAGYFKADSKSKPYSTKFSFVKRYDS